MAGSFPWLARRSQALLDKRVESLTAPPLAIRPLWKQAGACPRRFIQDLPLGGSFVVDVARSVPPILKVFVTDNQKIDGHIEGTKEAIQTDDLRKAIGGFLFHHHFESTSGTMPKIMARLIKIRSQTQFIGSYLRYVFTRPPCARGSVCSPRTRLTRGCRPRAGQIRGYFGLLGTGPLYAGRLGTTYSRRLAPVDFGSLAIQSWAGLF